MKISKILICSTLLISIFCSECTDKESPLNDEECNNLGVDENNKVCVRRQSEGPCVETDVCTEVKYTATPEICSNLKVSDEKDETYACSKNSADGSTDCIEANKCIEILYVKNEGDCSKFIISDENKDTHSCIKNPDGNNCIEKKINCEDKASGGSDIICPQLNPSDVQHTCIKDPDPDGNGCKNIFYCEFASGNSDEECKKYPVKNEGSECKKKTDESKCEEKPSQASEDGKDSDKGEEKESDTTEKEDEKEKDSDKGKEKGSDATDKEESGAQVTDKANSTEANKDKTGENDKEGKANFIGLSLVLLSLLFII